MTLRDTAIALRNAAGVRAFRRPGHVCFVGRARMYLDPGENRGSRVLAGVGSTRLRNSILWSAAVRNVVPQLVLDIGANYGEIGLSASYEVGTTLIFVEANPTLVPYLERSVNSLMMKQSGVKAVVAGVAAGSRPGKADFFIDTKSSGESRLDGLRDDRIYRSTTVRVERIDDLVPVEQQVHRLVFKLDIEGGELDALIGMRNTLESVDAFVGLVELSRAHQEASGHRLEELWDELRVLGSVFLFDRTHRLRDCSALTWSDLEAIAPIEGLVFDRGADAVVARGVDDVSRLAPQRTWYWTERFAKRLFPAG